MDQTNSVQKNSKRNQEKLERVRKKIRIIESKLEEKSLENIVFNIDPLDLKHIDNQVDFISIDVNKAILLDECEELFVLDRVGDNRNRSIDENKTISKRSKTVNRSKSSQKESPIERRKVWYDEDDELEIGQVLNDCKKLPKQFESKSKYKDFLEQKFTSIFEPQKWVQDALEENLNETRRQQEAIPDDRDEDYDDRSIERTAFDRLKSDNQSRLSEDFLHVKKCFHLNRTSKVRTSLNCLDFHPSSTIALIGSPIGLVRLFAVDGKINSLLQSIYFQGLRLSNARFISNQCGSEQIIVGSDGSNPKCNGFCYYYDLHAGKILRVRLSKGERINFSLQNFEISPDGSLISSCDSNGIINLLTTKTKEFVQEIKVNGVVDCLAFSPDSNYLIAHGQYNGGQAFVFDIRNVRRPIPCFNRFNDMNTIAATSMAISRNGSNIAIGSNTGAVNLYRFDDVLKQTDPKPLKSILNLTTSISTLRFNHDGQLLMISSNLKDDSIRIFNTHTMTVYKNFPLFVDGKNGKTYGRINDHRFSPNSGYFSFVNGYGTAHLFRIHEYDSY